MSCPRKRSCNGCFLDERFELRHELAVPAECQVGLDPQLEGGQPKLPETRDGVLDERLVGEVRERCAPPERERLSQDRACTLRLPFGECRPTLLHEALEMKSVELIRCHHEGIAAGPRLERAG